MAYMYSGSLGGGVGNPSQNKLLRNGAGLTGGGGVRRLPGGITPPRYKPTQPTEQSDARGIPITPGGSTTHGAPWAGAYRGGMLPQTKGSWGGGVPAGGGGGGGFAPPSGPAAPGPAAPSWAADLEYQAGPDIPDFVGGPAIPGQAAAANYTAYDPTLWNDDKSHDTEALIAAARPALDERMANEMGAASRRFGASGAIRSSGHRRGLEGAERKMFNDLNAMDLRYRYDAGQQDANRSLSAFGDYEGRRAGEAARRTGFDVGQQDRTDAYNKFAYGAGVGQQDRQNENNRFGYGAGMTEAQRRQAFDELKARFGG